MSKAVRIFVHCTATPLSIKVNREWLRHEFFDVKGWKHWGYHAVVYPNGTWERLQPLPPPSEAGAILTDATCANGAKGYNRDSIHIAYVGGVVGSSLRPADTRTLEQKKTLRAVIGMWKEMYHISEVVGHRDLPGVKKACPCFDARSAYANA